MPGATTDGYPYPLPTEPVADGAVAIQSLANAVSARLGVGIVSGIASWTLGGSPVNTTVTLPAGYFPAAPDLQLTMGSQTRVLLNVVSVDATAFTFRGLSPEGSTGSFQTYWLAVSAP